MNQQPLLIGITGGIGSGKSTIAKVFKALGVPVFDADAVAKNCMNNDQDLIEKIKAQFGNVYADGKLDRVKMATIVFGNQAARQQLNSLVHPKVAECFEKWIEANKTAPILLKEAAILIESGAYQQMDKIITVVAPEELRIQRVVARDGFAEQEVNDRMNAQLSDEERQKYADYTINNGGRELVIPQVLAVHQQLNPAAKLC